MQALQFAGSEVALGAVVGDYRWFVEDFHAARQQLAFVNAGRESLAAQPFLDHRWNQQGLPRAQAHLENVKAAIGCDSPPRLNFIWHTSFCCSTLLVHAFDAPGRCLPLSEPLVLVSMADTKRAATLEQGWHLSGLAETVFRLMARPECEGASVLVKPSNFANILLPDAARLTKGRSLFLYSDLSSFLVSITKTGFALRKYVRKLFTNLIGHQRDRLPWSQAEIFQMSDLEIAALAWHLQMLEFREALSALGTRAVSLNCDDFLDRPRDTLLRLDAFFGLGLGVDHWDAVLGGSHLLRHAKSPSVAYSPDQRRADAESVRRQLGADLDRVEEWSYRACPVTPRSTPLPRPLQTISM